MHCALRAADRAFRGILDRYAYDQISAPSLRRIYHHRLPHGREWEFVAKFTDDRSHAWRIDYRDFLGAPPLFKANVESELTRLFSRVFEDHFATQMMASERRMFEEFAATTLDQNEINRRRTALLEREEEVRSVHQTGAPSHMVEISTAGMNNRRDYDRFVFAELDRQNWLATNPPIIRPGMEYVNESDDVRMSVLYGMQMAWHSGDVGSKEAQKRAEKLLLEWLSPPQRHQYLKEKSFDVCGGESGKTYRIRHGRQMNIDELDKAGKKVCTWCFLPEGQCPAGDVMLAQKIAIENFENKALATANRFGERSVFSERRAATWERMRSVDDASDWQWGVAPNPTS